MIFAVAHLGVKLNQDRSGVNTNPEHQGLILCDGIGSLAQSEQAAEFVVSQFQNLAHPNSESLIRQLIETPPAQRPPGGTTFIIGHAKSGESTVAIEYIGNGSVIHLHGCFAENSMTDTPYMYSNIVVPHIAPDDSLTRHLSNDSNKEQLKPGKITIDLNYPAGDILLFLSDGINSLERQVVIEDESGRFWRYENPALQTIIQELSTFIKSEAEVTPQVLQVWISEILQRLNASNLLDDDAAMGIIMTERVLKREAP